MKKILIVIIFFLCVKSFAEIRVGVLHSISGTLAVSEKDVLKSTLIALSEIRKKGLLKEKVTVIIKDGASNPDHFKKMAEELIIKNKVSVVFGCWTSSCRKSVKPVFEKYNHVLFYPIQYEGAESSDNIVYLGSTPNKQIVHSVRWAKNKLKSKRALLVGSDYIYPRMANFVLKKVLKNEKIELVGEHYVPLGTNDMRHVLKLVKKLKPDIVFNTINGTSNIPFLEKISNPEYNVKNIISYSLTESDISHAKLSTNINLYSVWSYFNNIKSKENKKLRKLFSKYLGEYYITSPMYSSYLAVQMWKKAVEKANSYDPAQVREYIKGITYKGANGKNTILENNHVKSSIYIAKANKKGGFSSIEKIGNEISARPYFKLFSKKEWSEAVRSIYKMFNNSWENEGFSISELNKQKQVEVYISKDVPYVRNDPISKSDFGIIGNYIRDIYASNNILVKFLFLPKSRLKNTKKDIHIYYTSKETCPYFPSKNIWIKTIGLGYLDNQIKKGNDFTFKYVLQRGEDLPESLVETYRNKNVLRFSWGEQMVRLLLRSRADHLVIDEYTLDYYNSLDINSIFKMKFKPLEKRVMCLCFKDKGERDLFNSKFVRFKSKRALVLPKPIWR